MSLENYFGNDQILLIMTIWFDNEWGQSPCCITMVTICWWVGGGGGMSTYISQRGPPDGDAGQAASYSRPIQKGGRKFTDHPLIKPTLPSHQIQQFGRGMEGGQ